MVSTLMARLAAALEAAHAAAADPWALPAGLEWYGGAADTWDIRTVDRQPLHAHGVTAEMLDQLDALIVRRDTEDPYPGKAGTVTIPMPSMVRVTCGCCKGTKYYVGLGVFQQQEPCRTCGGAGTIELPVGPPAEGRIRKLEGELVLDPWALPAEVEARGLKWHKGWSWQVSNAAADAAVAHPRSMPPDAIQLFESPPGSGTVAGPAGDLSPELQLELFALIQRRNTAEPNGPP